MGKPKRFQILVQIDFVLVQKKQQNFLSFKTLLV
jgi:hypothetical protein